MHDHIPLDFSGSITNQFDGLEVTETFDTRQPAVVVSEYLAADRGQGLVMAEVLRRLDALTAEVRGLREEQQRGVSVAIRSV